MQFTKKCKCYLYGCKIPAKLLTLNPTLNPQISAHVVSLTEAMILHLSTSCTWPVSLWQAGSHNAISHSQVHSLITDPGAERVSFKVPKDTGDAIKSDARVEKWDVPWQPSDESCLPFCAFPFTPSLPLWSLQTRSLHAYLRISSRFSIFLCLWATCHKHLVWGMSWVA